MNHEPYDPTEGYDKDGAMVGQGPIARALLAALGLTDRKVTAIEFRCAVNEVVSIKVEEIISVDAVMGVTKALSEYTLIRKEQGEIDITRLADTHRRFAKPKPKDEAA